MCSADHSKITPFRIALNNVMSNVKDDCALLRGSYNIHGFRGEGDSGVPHTFEGQGHKIRLRHVCPG